MKCPNCNHHFHYKQAVIVEYNGVPMSLRELASETGLSVSTIRNRYVRGDRGSRLVRPADEKYAGKVAQSSKHSQEIHVEPSA